MTKEEALARVVDSFAMFGLIVLSVLAGFIAGRSSKASEE